MNNIVLTYEIEGYSETVYLSLTDDQIKLLDYFLDNGVIQGHYEKVNKFETV